MTLSIPELEELLLKDEDEHLEFKRAETRFDFEKLVQYCVALANERGGRIFLGVSDKKPRCVVGTPCFENPEKTKSALLERIHLRIDLDEVIHPDGRVLIFRIPSRPIGMPIQYDGRYFMRSGESLVPMVADQIKKILDETGPDYSAEVCHGASIEDLDPTAIDEFRERWIRKSGNQKLSSLTYLQLLEDAELAIRNELTYASLILFGTRSTLGRFLANAETIFEYRSSDASGPAQERKEYRQGFFSWYDEAWNLVNLRNDLQHYQSGLFMHDIPTFNERAIREALLNAISHRDYRLGGSVFVRQYPRRIEIVSPGGLPEGISIENILWNQAPRNRRLAEAFARCGLVERSGQGMNLIFEATVRESKAEPDFSRTDAFNFWITLHGQVRHPEFLRVLEKIDSHILEGFGTEDFMALEYVYEGRELADRFGKAAKRLFDLGLLEHSTDRKKGFIIARQFYAVLGKAGVYTRQKGLDRETNKELLLRHIRESGTSGARMDELIQVLPSNGRDGVRSLLRSLRSESRILLRGAKRGSRWYLSKDMGHSANDPK